MRAPDEFVHPFSQAARADPYPAYRWLRTNQPVYHDPTSRMWLLTRHADCSTALRDPRFSAALGQRERVRDNELPSSMLTTDAAAHERLRAPGMLLLGPAAVREHAPGFVREADLLLDRLMGRVVVDAIADLGEPFAAGIFAVVLQLPEADRSHFTQLARRVAVNLDPLAGADAAAQGTVAMRELHGYLDSHVNQLVGAASEGPLVRLATDSRLTRAEMIAILSLCVVGGFEPLVHLVGNALTWLLPRPDAIERLRHSDERGARAAVDELLRLESPIPFTMRVTTADVALTEITVPAGSRVLAILAAANRDPLVFPAPDEIVLDRHNPQLAFGTGPHFCLGTSLVRQAASVMLTRFARRFRQVALAQPSADVRWRQNLVPRGVVALPLRLG